MCCVSNQTLLHSLNLINNTLLFYLHLQVKLPTMSAKAPDQTNQCIEMEELVDFWVVMDMLTFENVGFSNTVDGIKYLVCADCEAGPIGFQNTKDPNMFYVALRRVRHMLPAGEELMDAEDDDEGVGFF